MAGRNNAISTIRGEANFQHEEQYFQMNVSVLNFQRCLDKFS